MAQRSLSAFDAHLGRLQKNARQVGIEVVSLPAGRIVYEYRSRDAFIPASLVKILTSYTALKQLGSRHRFLTSVWATEQPQGGTLPGNIWIKSEGDIFLLGENIGELPDRLKELGLRRIEGGVYVDNGYFEPSSEQICLDENCASSYNPVVTPTALEFNTITFRVDPSEKPGSPVRVTWFPPGDYVQLTNLATTSSKRAKTVLKIRSLGMAGDGRERFQVSGKLPIRTSGLYEYRFNVDAPASFFAHSFKAMLRQAGIEVKGSITSAGAVPNGAKRLAVHESPPLGELIYGLNRYSNNFMAEMLLRSMGAAAAGPPGSVEKGVVLIRKALRQMGIPEAEVLLDCGSGLSRECRVSPSSFCRVLFNAYRDPSIAPDFLSSLAVNGQDGTLRNRMQRSDLIIRGKTGTLNNVVGFAGYVEAAGKDPCIAVILMNDVQNLWGARKAMDSFLEQLPTLMPTGKSGKHEGQHATHRFREPR